MRNVILVIHACLLCNSLAIAGSWDLPVMVDPEVSVSYESARLVAEGPFVAIEQPFTIHNRHNKTLEANLNLALPQQQRMRSYALQIDGQMRDAVIVERVKGRVAFESIVRQEVDPSLVERRSGNQYNIRVFPVPANGQRQAMLSLSGLATRKACGWETTLSRDLVNKLALSKTPGIIVHSTTKPRTIGLRATRVKGMKDTWALNIAESKSVKSVQFCLPTGKNGKQSTWKTIFDSEVHFVEIHSNTRNQRLLPSNVELVWDNSFSMHGRKIHHELDFIEQYFADRDVEILLTLLAHEVSVPKKFSIVNGDTTALRDYLSTLVPDGSTRLGSWIPSANTEEILMFTDAIDTWPDNDLFMNQVKKPVHIISAVSEVDPAAVRQLTRAGGKFFNLISMTSNEASDSLKQRSASWQLPPLLAAQEMGHGWHAAETASNEGVLRACAIGDQPSAATWTSPDGYRSDIDLSNPLYLNIATSREMVFWCASWASESMAGNQPKMSSTRAAFAKKYNIVTNETSMIVLEQAEDYVRYGILPTSDQIALRALVESALLTQKAQLASNLEKHKQQLATSWEARKAWWATEFPKNGPRPVLPFKPETDSGNFLTNLIRRLGWGSQSESSSPMSSSPPVPVASSSRPPSPSMSGTPSIKSTTSGQTINIQIQPDNLTLNAYDSRFAQALSIEQLEQVYLDTRGEHLRNIGYFLQVAERFYALNDSKGASRVLSNLVEQFPMEHSILRLVAYRLLQEEPKSEDGLSLLKKIVHLAPEEPASHRDLAIALADNGKCDQAANTLAHVVNTPWPSRFPDVSVIALAELNAMTETCVMTNPIPVSDELLASIPVELRIVLTWNVKDTDIDLHVIDPNKERTYYGSPRSYQGGKLSRDSIQGNGPEEFILRNPLPGEYQVLIKFFGSTQARLSRDATIKVQFQTGFGTKDMKVETKVLNLLPSSEIQLVGTFQVENSTIKDKTKN